MLRGQPFTSDCGERRPFPNRSKPVDEPSEEHVMGREAGEGWQWQDRKDDG
jgi:hypothetical protein